MQKNTLLLTNNVQKRGWGLCIEGLPKDAAVSGLGKAYPGKPL